MTQRGVSDKIRAEVKWMPVVGFENFYSVSSAGLVARTGAGKGTYPGKVLKQFPKGCGYPSVRIKERWRAVHRLVMAAFRGPCPVGMEVNHIDGDKSNNDVSNLEYVTPSENHRHAYRIGLMKAQRGSGNSNSKLMEGDVLAIRRRLNSGEIQRLIAGDYGVSRSLIRAIKLGEAWGWLDAS